MDHSDKKRLGTVGAFLGTALFVIGLIMKIVTIVAKDGLIISGGVRMYNTLSTLSLILIVAGLAAGLAAAGFLLFSGRKEENERIMAEAARDDGPDLRIKGELDPLKIRENIRKEASTWTEVPASRALFAGLYKTMDDMDGYQAKLKALLDRNGADALRDTEEVLDKVEQHICRNIRKLLNILIVLDEKSEDDRNVMMKNVTECTEDNERLLDLTKNFMMAVSQFLNSQGEDGSTIREVESYKKILSDQMMMIAGRR